MKFLKEGDKAAVKIIDSNSVNKWCWKWPEEIIKCNIPKVGEVHYKLDECIKKVDIDGHGWCLWCDDKILSASNSECSSSYDQFYLCCF